MTYQELVQVFKTTELLPYDERLKSFSDGVLIIAKYLKSDFANTHIEIISKFDAHFKILYGNIEEFLDELTYEDAYRLAELGWDYPKFEDTHFSLIL